MPDPALAHPAPVQPLLQTVGLTKRYGDFLANDRIDIEIVPREIHALLGENGAGKSTLVKTIYGLVQPSGGELRWQGRPIKLSGPSEARSLGIGMVFQHFSLFDNLTVAENVALGLDGKEPLRAVSARLADVGTDEAVERFLRALDVAQSVQRTGSAALNLCCVASGRVEAFWSTSLKPWDMAAGVLLVEEAGGKVTCVDDSTFVLDEPDILATNGTALHAQTVEMLKRKG